VTWSRGTDEIQNLIDQGELEQVESSETSPSGPSPTPCSIWLQRG